MAFLKSLDITGSALTAERFHSDVILQNIANSKTTSATGDAYRRKQVIFQERPISFKDTLANAQGGVRVANVVESQEEFKPVYDPTHPHANEEGYVMYPNVDSTEEMVDLMASSNAYEANITALAITKAMITRTLDLSK